MPGLLQPLDVVHGDRYAGEFPREQFRKHGIDYQPSERSKSDLYRDLLPLLNSGRIDLLDHARLLSQLASLERRTARGGVERIRVNTDEVQRAIVEALQHRITMITGRIDYWRAFWRKYAASLGYR